MATTRQHISLIWQLSKRDILARYRGSFLGLMWSFITPLVMLAIYSFVFTFVFKTRWGHETGAKGEFAVILFAGLLLHALFAECLVRSPVIITSNPNFVKKVVFPLHILIPVQFTTAFFHFLMGMTVFCIANIIVMKTIHWTIVFLPVIWLPFIIFCMGMMWFLAALGVYFRDINQTMGVITTLLLFLSPILFPSTLLPEKIHYLIYLNPLSFIVEQSRAVAIWGNMPHLQGIVIYSVVSVLVFFIGLASFEKMRKGFADVL